jgi:hypothetical protein
MPELTFHRGRPAKTPPAMACMYCGLTATHAAERRVRNPKRDPAPAASGDDLPTFGDDPVSGVLAVLWLGLWLCLAVPAAVLWLYRTAQDWAAPALDPPYTVVTITTCDDHRWSGLRRTLAVWGCLAAVGLVLGWYAWFELVAHPDEPTVWWSVTAAVLTAIVGLTAAPVVAALGVRVKDRRRDSVTLDGVCAGYFDRVGLPLPRRKAS